MPRIYFNTADAHYNLKEYDSARVYYQKVLSEYPASPLVTDAMTGLQYTYQAEGRPAGAVAEIDKYLAASGQSGSREEMMFKKADILFGQGDYGSAAMEYEAILKMNPGRNVKARTLYQLGRVYELENNRQKALVYYEEILSDYDDTEVAPSVRLQTGINYINSKKYSSAVEVLGPYETKYSTSPQIAEARFQLGVALMHLPDAARARTQFKTVIEKHPADVFADRSRINLARIHQGAKQYQASTDTLEKVVSTRNDDIAGEALLMIGENYLAQKKAADALQAFKDVYEQYGEFPLLVERGRFGAGEAYERLRDKKQAEALYELILASPIDPEVKKGAEAGLQRVRQ
jgi:TolA-binding protein